MLNENDLNAPIKRQVIRLDEKTKLKYMLFVNQLIFWRNSLLLSWYRYIKSKIIIKVILSNTNEKKAGVTTVITNKDFETKKIIRKIISYLKCQFTKI